MATISFLAGSKSWDTETFIFQVWSRDRKSVLQVHDVLDAEWTDDRLPWTTRCGTGGSAEDEDLPTSGKAGYRQIAGGT